MGKTINNDFLQSQALEVEQEKRVDEANQAYANADYATAFPIYKELAKEGNPRALFNCAICYELGLGTMKNRDQAIYYYVESAKKGFVRAYKNLSELFSVDTFQQEITEKCGTDFLIKYNSMCFADSPEMKRLIPQDDTRKVQIDKIQFYYKKTDDGNGGVFVFSTDVKIQGLKGKKVFVSFIIHDSTRGEGTKALTLSDTWEIIVPYNAAQWINLPSIEYDDSILQLKKNEEKVFGMRISVHDEECKEYYATEEKSFSIKSVKPFLGKQKWEITEI